ncbi:ABC transporter family protein, partial [Chlamydia psittaci 84-8471/1]
IRHGLKT